MARPISILEVTDEERCELQRRVRAPSTTKRDHVRAQIISLRSEGLSQKEVAARFHVHFTPTASSWMNLVERFFADLTRDVVCEGSFSSIRALVSDIEAYLAKRNDAPKPYRWKAKGEEIWRKSSAPERY